MKTESKKKGGREEQKEGEKGGRGATTREAPAITNGGKPSGMIVRQETIKLVWAACPANAVHHLSTRMVCLQALDVAASFRHLISFVQSSCGAEMSSCSEVAQGTNRIQMFSLEAPLIDNAGSISIILTTSRGLQPILTMLAYVCVCARMPRRW